jgi:hypothetical protein
VAVNLSQPQLGTETHKSSLAEAVKTEPKLLLELVKVKRFLHMPSGKMYIRQPANARTEDEVNAFEFSMGEAREMLAMKDPNGLPLFRTFINRKARRARAEEDTGAVRPVKFPSSKPDLSVEDLDTGTPQRVTKATRVDIEDDDPELEARLAALDSASDEPSVTVG